MKTMRCGLLLGVFLLSVANSFAESLVEQTQLEQAGLMKLWEAHLPLSDGDTISTAYVVDESLYVVTEAGTLFSIQADVGLLRWANKIADRDYRINRPTHLWTGDATGSVIVQASTGLTLCDRFTGAVVAWFSPAQSSSGGPVIGAGSTLFIGGRDGIFHALEMSKDSTSEPTMRWQVRLDGPVVTAPTLFGDGKLLMASQAGTVYSCGASDKTIAWAYRTGGSIVADPAVDAAGVYVASTDRSLYKLSATRGSLRWRRRLPSPLVDAPVAIGNTVFQAGADFGIAAIDSASGKIRWQRDDSRQFVARLHERDALWAKSGTLLLVEHDSGRLAATIRPAGAIGAVTNPLDEAIFLLGARGEVFCAHPTGSPYLRVQQVNAARARLNLPPVAQASSAETGSAAQKRSPSRPADPLRSRRDPGR